MRGIKAACSSRRSSILAGISYGSSSPRSKNPMKCSMMICVRSSSTSACHVMGSRAPVFDRPRETAADDVIGLHALQAAINLGLQRIVVIDHRAEHELDRNRFSAPTLMLARGMSQASR